MPGTNANEAVGRLVLTLCALTAVAPATFAQHGRSRPAVPDFESGLPIGVPVGHLPRPVTSFGATSSGGYAYVLGGYFGQPHHYVTKHQSRAFYRFPVADPSRIELLPNDDRIQSVALVEHQGRVIRAGGMAIVDDVTRSVDVVREFDPRTGAWSDLPPLPAPRSSHDARCVGDRLYVAGGWALSGSSGGARWYDEVWSLDLKDPGAGWSRLPQPFRRRALGVAAVGRSLIAVGGIDENGDVSSRVDVLDTESGEWSRGPDYPGFGFGVAVREVAGRAYASGMEGALYSWAPGDDSWSRAGTLVFPRFFHQLVPGPAGTLLALGGIGDDSRPSHIERLRIFKAAGQDPTFVHWSVPSPSAAKNRQGVFVSGNSLILFGGNNSLGQHDFEPENFLAESWRLDLSTLEFSRLADFRAGRQTMQTVTSRTGKVGWSVGGFGHDGEVARAFDDVYRYQVADDQWTLAGRLPSPRTQFGLALRGRELFVFGGLDYDPRRPRDDRFRHLTSVLRGKASSEVQFEDAGVELPRPRRAFAGAVLNDRYYLIGGMRDGFELVEPCDVFDFETRSWSTIPGPKRPRLSGQLVALSGRLYLIGGSSPDAKGDLSPNPSVEVFDPATSTWEVAAETLPLSPRHLRAFPWRGHVLLYSAHEADAVVRVGLLRPSSATRSASG